MAQTTQIFVPETGTLAIAPQQRPSPPAVQITGPEQGSGNSCGFSTRATPTHLKKGPQILFRFIEIEARSEFGGYKMSPKV